MAEPKSKALALRRQPVPVLEIRTLADVMELAERLAKSELVPKEYRGKPENILVAVQMGAEVGLKTMQALQSIAVINGRPSLWGDAGLAIVMAHPDFEWIKEADDLEKQVASCTIKRRGLEPVLRTFSQAEADAVSVAERDAQGNVRWGKLSERAVWKSYKKRMRQMRARWWAMKDTFPDALKGLEGREWVEADLAGTVQAEPDEVASADMMPRRKSLEAGLSGTDVGQGTTATTENASVDTGRATAPETGQLPAHPVAPPDPWAELREVLEPEVIPEPEAIPVLVGAKEPGGAADSKEALRPGAVTFELNGQPVTTAGITKDTLLKAFKLGALADELKGKGTAKNLLGAEYGVEHRDELTDPQGRAYVTALTKIINSAQAEKRRG